ncbi:hypothetical protein [Mesorhizobium sp. CAU 1741]|uniref:hypothetical protein n=1 Tax=Mesorhizobium sp. CAU 1741 TaxID=3140366 RepID=UPI00325A6482
MTDDMMNLRALVEKSADDRLVQLCEDLKIHGVAGAYGSVTAAAAEQGQSFTDYPDSVLHAERNLLVAKRQCRLQPFRARILTHDQYQGFTMLTSKAVGNYYATPDYAPGCELRLGP